MDQGSEFVVRVRLSLNKPFVRLTVSVTASAGLPSRKILVVGDNVDSASMLEMDLTMQNYEVSIANEGESAVKAAPELRPDLIFLDLGLPDNDGHEVAARIRKQLPNALIVALSD